LVLVDERGHWQADQGDALEYALFSGLRPMSSDTFDLVEAASRCAQAAWPKDHTRAYGFTKAGIMLDDLLRLEDRPLTLFDAEKPKSQALMTALDQVNHRFGKKTMVLASEGMECSWKLRTEATRVYEHLIQSRGHLESCAG